MIELQPTTYSKNKTIATITAKLKIAPDQIPNSYSAWRDHVMEFVPHGNPFSPVGTLTEYANIYNETEFIIHTIDGIIKVNRSGSRFTIIGTDVC